MAKKGSKKATKTKSKTTKPKSRSGKRLETRKYDYDATPNFDKHGRFAKGNKFAIKKGEVRNPEGKHSYSLTYILKKMLQCPSTAAKIKQGIYTVGHELMHAAIEHAEKGDRGFFIELFNRLDGKVPDRIISGAEGGPLSSLSDEDLLKITEAGKAHAKTKDPKDSAPQKKVKSKV